MSGYSAKDNFDIHKPFPGIKLKADINMTSDEVKVGQ